MEPIAVREAIAEAERFIEIAEVAFSRMLRDGYPHRVVSKETSACRRASMDLSRALTRLRQS